jgi:hypothetical protein
VLIVKVLDPFFKKKHAGFMMPVKITGTYEHPSFGLDLSDVSLSAQYCYSK